MAYWVDRAFVAEMFRRTEEEIVAFEAEGMPFLDVQISGITVRRFDAPMCIDWYIARGVRRATSH